MVVGDLCTGDGDPVWGAVAHGVRVEYHIVVLLMLARWVNVLPVFVVRWLAIRYCERFPWYYEGRVKRTFVVALPDCYFKLPEGQGEDKS